MTTTYGRRADHISAYTFQAATYCPECTLAAVKAAHPLDYPLAATIQDFDTPEDILRTVARSLNIAGAGINTEDERSFDSDNFPKVVFSCQIEGPESCESCGQELY